MSHIGSLLFLPSGVYGWEPVDPAHLKVDDFALLFADVDKIQFVLLGTGAARISPSTDLSCAFADAGIGLEVMDTGAAARTYNVLLAEQRDVAAALIAVD